jgi:hypothetical protein
MTNKYAGNGLWTGLSTDTKPVSPAGYRYFETDTGDTLFSDGTYWWLTGMPSAYSQRKVGYFPMGSSGTVGTGILSTLTGATGAGSQNFGITDTTNGRFLTAITGTTTGNKGGLRVNIGQLTIRNWNPRIRIRFKCVTTTLQRLCLGLTTNAEPAGDDPFAVSTYVGVALGCKSGDTNFQILHDDTAAGTTIFDDTGVAIDTEVHTVSIVADEDNSRFSWSLDGSVYTHITTNIPTTQNLTVVLQNETNESGVAKSFQLFNVFVQSDK